MDGEREVERIKPDPGVTAAVLRSRAERINIYDSSHAADLANIAKDAANVIDALLSRLTSRDSVRNEALEEAREVCAKAGEDYRSSMASAESQDDARVMYDRWIAADVCAIKIQTLKSSPGAGGVVKEGADNVSA